MTRTLRWAGLTFLSMALLASGATAAEKSTRKANEKPDAAALSQAIDREIGKVLAVDSHKAAILSDDAEFLRRAYLDLTGVIPTADQARSFLDSKEANKRAKLVDELLASGNYGRHMADMWLSMMVPRNSDNRRLQQDPFLKWLEVKFNENTPWDKFVTEVLTATGTQAENPAVTFFLANATADKVTDQVSRHFLGVRLECAQCHNHPFTSYKQNDYWGMAAFFIKVQAGNINKAAKDGTSPGIVENPKLRTQKGLPESAKTLPAKFLQQDEAKVTATEPLRPVFSQWLVSAENKYFARSMVNKLWGQMFGRGIVNPIDDMHDGNTATHPELLNQLADDFVASGFDVKHLLRGIALSQAYQRTSKVAAATDEAQAKFGRMAVKVMTPEQLYDSLETIIGKQANGRPDRKAQVQKGQPNTARAAFVAFFDVDETAEATEYQAGIPQALRLMNSAVMNGNNVLMQQLAKEKPETAFETIYLATLSRRPTKSETAMLTAHVAKVGDARKASSDILWAVLNSSEFALNH